MRGSLSRSPPTTERVRGFEPLTVCLGSRYATTASHPQSHCHYSQVVVESQMLLYAGHIPGHIPGRIPSWLAGDHRKVLPGSGSVNPF